MEEQFFDNLLHNGILIQSCYFITMRFRITRTITNLPYYHGIQWGGFFHNLTRSLLLKNGYDKDDPQKMTKSGFILKTHECAFRNYSADDEYDISMMVPSVLYEDFKNTVINLHKQNKRPEEKAITRHFSLETLDFVSFTGSPILVDDQRIVDDVKKILHRKKVKLIAVSPAELKRPPEDRTEGHRFVDPSFLFDEGSQKKAWGTLIENIRNIREETRQILCLCDPAQQLVRQNWLYYRGGYAKKSEIRKELNYCSGIWGGAEFKGPFSNETALALALLRWFGTGTRPNIGFGNFCLPEIFEETPARNTIWKLSFNAENLINTIQTMKEKDAPDNSKTRDGITIGMLKTVQPSFWQGLSGELQDKTYTFSPFTKGSIQIPGKEPRPLAVTSILDRVIARCASDTLENLIEGYDTSSAETRIETSLFSPYSWAYRKGRGTHGAAAEAAEKIRSGGEAVKSDISHFFPSVHTECLLLLCSALLPRKDPFIPWLESIFSETAKIGLTGLPQGHPISPLLSNLYLTGFDQIFSSTFSYIPECEGKPSFIRYADDILAISNNPGMISAEQLVSVMQNILTWYGLELKEEKTTIFEASKKIPFLGFEISPGKAEVIQKEGAEHTEWSHIDWQSFICGNTLYLSRAMNKITIQGKFIHLTSGQTERIIPLSSVGRVLLSGQVSITTGVLFYCIHHDIPVFFTDIFGKLKAECLPILQQRSQLHFYQEKLKVNRRLTMQYIRTIIRSKIQNSRLLLYILSNTSGTPWTFEDSLFEHQLQTLSLCENEAEALGCEGSCAKQYWGLLSQSKVFKPFTFEYREYHPAPDPINALLSFSYTLLYHRIASILLTEGLNPRSGFFHCAHGTHAALASDIMEPLRVCSDAFVIHVIKTGKITVQDFSLTRNGSASQLQGSAFFRFIQLWEEWALNSVFIRKGKPLSLRDLADSLILEYKAAVRLHTELPEIILDALPDFL